MHTTRVAGVLSLLMALAAVSVTAQAACPGMHVQIRNIRNSTGTVDCALFESPAGFPTEALRGHAYHGDQSAADASAVRLCRHPAGHVCPGRLS